MAVRGHCDEIDLALLGEANELGGRIAHRQLDGTRNDAADSSEASCSRYARSSFISSDSRSSSSKWRAAQPSATWTSSRSAPVSLANSACASGWRIGGGVLDGDQDRSAHGYSTNVWYSRKAFSAAMITATVQASTRIQ